MAGQQVSMEAWCPTCQEKVSNKGVSHVVYCPCGRIGISLGTVFESTVKNEEGCGVMNMMDAEMVKQDIIRRDECDELFDAINKASKVHPDADLSWVKQTDQYKSGYAAGLQEALDILDGRITWLREKWS